VKDSNEFNGTDEEFEYYDEEEVPSTKGRSSQAKH